jgi:hypothetical protein
MPAEIVWLDASRADVLRMDYEVASRICAAVHDFVASLEPEQAGVAHLRVEGCTALVDLRGGVAYVQRLIVDEPLPHAVVLLDEAEPPESG